MNQRLLLLSFVGVFALFDAKPSVAQEGAGELGAPAEGQSDTPVQAEVTPPVVAAPVVATPPAAGTVTLRGTQMTANGRVYELGCNAGMHFAHGHVVYVQCAGAVVVVDTAAASATTHAVAGMPTNFFEQGGRVWVELNHDTAHPVEALPSLAPAAAQQPQLTPQQQSPVLPQQPGAPLQGLDPELAARGEVVKFESGDVHIRFQGSPQIYSGTRVAFTAEGIEPVVGTLSARRGDVFVARVSFGETVPVGAEAQITNAPTTGNSAVPERAGGVRLAFTVRGLIGAGEDGGGGVIADADLEWRLRAPVFLRLLLEPLGVGFGEQTVGFAGGHFLAGYDSSFLAIGVGIGFQLVEADLVDDFTFERSVGVGTSIGFLLRVGSPEGFHVELFNAMTYVDQFRFGSLRIRAQWGLGHRNWMVLRGGGGITRAAYGEIGFKRLLSGWSSNRPFFLTASFGGSAIYSDVDRFSLYAGPTFGLSLETVF